LLIDRLQQMGVKVERPAELLGYSESADGIEARLRGADGAETSVRARFIAGCDGAHSKIREVMKSGFPGGTYGEVFYVADIDGEGPAFNGDLNVDLEDSDSLRFFPWRTRGGSG
jgi:2-polyprenyl-6-methoxyphenol hydroxylase-like FAD-dependent oxidoreductase